MSEKNDKDNVKQIQFSADFFKAKKRRASTRKKKEPHLSNKTVNTIKNNLVQRIQSHKADEMGGIEKIHSDAALKKINAAKPTTFAPVNAMATFSNAMATPVNPPTNHLTDAMQYLSKINPEKPT